MGLWFYLRCFSKQDQTRQESLIYFVLRELRGSSRSAQQLTIFSRWRSALPL